VRFGARLPPVGLQALAVAGTLVNSVLVANCTTAYGGALNSFAYIWIGIYAGQFFEQRAARFQCAVLVVASGVALELSGLPGMVTAWVLVAGSSVLASEALARLNGFKLVNDRYAHAAGETSCSLSSARPGGGSCAARSRATVWVCPRARARRTAAVASRRCMRVPAS
jgi:hypothetical protein